MTILVDNRAGSKDLAPHLPKKLVVMCRMEFGDVAFTGNGPADSLLTIGIEHKQLSDVLQCIENGRFAGTQLPGMNETYDVRYLLIEGAYRSSPRDGMLEVPRAGGWVPAQFGRRRAWMYRDLEHWLATVEIKGGMHIKRAFDKRESAEVIMGLYTWWQKEWEDHKSLEAFDTSGTPTLLRKPILLRRIAAELADIGWKKSAKVEEHFDSVRQMMEAGPSEWMSIEGIGKTITARVVREINESKEEARRRLRTGKR